MDFIGVLPASADFLYELLGQKKLLKIDIPNMMLWMQFIKLQE